MKIQELFNGGGENKSPSCCWMIHHPLENFFVTTNEENKLMIVNHEGKKVLKKEIIKEQKEPVCATFIGTNYLLVGTKDNEVQCYGLKNLEFVGIIARSDNTITGLSLNRNSILCVSSLSDEGIQILDISDISQPKTIRKITVSGGVICSKINDNNIIVSLTRERDLMIWKVNEQLNIELIHQTKHQLDKQIINFWNNKSNTDNYLCPLSIGWHVCGDIIVAPPVSWLQCSNNSWSKKISICNDNGGANNYIISFSPNSLYVAVVDINCNLSFFEFNEFQNKKGKRFKTVKVDTPITSIEWSGSSNDVYLCDLNGNISMISDLVDDKQKTTYKLYDNERYLRESLMDVDEEEEVSEEKDVATTITDDDSKILALVDNITPTKKSGKKKTSSTKKEKFIKQLMSNKEVALKEEEEIEPLEVEDEEESQQHIKLSPSPIHPTDIDFTERINHFEEMTSNKKVLKHEAIQPSSSKFEAFSNEYKRYMAITQSIGMITASSSTEPELSSHYNIKIKFNISGHSEDLYKDNHKPHVAAINQYGIVFGSSPNSQIPTSVIQFRKLKVTAQDKGWKIALPKDERIELVTIGKNFVAAGIYREIKSDDKCYFVRIYDHNQMEMNNIVVGGNLISMCSSESNLILIYQQGESLFMDWYDLTYNCCVKSHRPLPTKELRWIGFGTETPDLLYYQDNNHFIYLFNPDTDSFSLWCDLKKHECFNNNSLLITIIDDTNIFAIPCKNDKYQPPLSRDMNSFSLQQINISDVYIGSFLILEKNFDKALISGYSKFVTKKVVFNQRARKRIANKDDANVIDRLLLSVVTRCIEMKESLAAYNCSKLFSVSTTLNAAIKYAESQKDTKLVSLLKNVKPSPNISNLYFPHAFNPVSNTSIDVRKEIEDYMTKEQVTELVQSLLKNYQPTPTISKPLSSVSTERIESSIDRHEEEEEMKETPNTTSSPNRVLKIDKEEGEAEVSFEDSPKSLTIPQMFSPKKPKRKSIENVKRRKSIDEKSTLLGNPFLALNEKRSQVNEEKQQETSKKTTKGNILSKITAMSQSTKEKSIKENVEDEDAKKRKRNTKENVEVSSTNNQQTTKKKKTTTNPSQPSVLQFVKKNVAVPQISSSALSSATKEALLQKQQSQEMSDEDDLGDLSNIIKQ
ncbi:hypothetical protein ABK040_014053 [Willaertia magna]